MTTSTTSPNNSAPEILVYGFIDSEMAMAFVSQLTSLAKTSDVVNCRVNSAGGDVFSGIAMYNAVKQAKCSVDMYIDGLCASMASCFVTAGRKVYISKFARVMTHKPSSAGFGNAEDLKELATHIEALEPVMADMYCGKTGLNREQATATFLQDKDTWFDADQAIAVKLADDKYDGPEVELPKEKDKKAVFAAYASMTSPITQQTGLNMKQISAALWAKVCAHLGITDSVDDAQFEAAVKKVMGDANKLPAIEAKLATKTTELEDLKKSQVTGQVTAMLDGAEAANKITAKQKSIFSAQYAEKPDALKEVLDTMGFTSIVGKLSQVDKNQTATPEVLALMAKGWDKLHKEGGLAELKAKHEEGYRDLYKGKFGYYPNEKPEPKK